MSRNQFRLPSDPYRAVKKFFLSAFVVVTFVAYVIYERLTRPDSPLSSTSPSVTITAAPPELTPFATTVGNSPSASFIQPTSAPQKSSAYKNGTYQGEVVDAYYGLVQVQVDIQGGAIQGVQFLQYPNDRRTSQQINSIAMPYLQQEAIQAQSAQVDIISGATLTSEGFQMSLQSALQAARQN